MPDYDGMKKHEALLTQFAKDVYGEDGGRDRAEKKSKKRKAPSGTTSTGRAAKKVS
jgi:hypothetical protein